MKFLYELSIYGYVFVIRIVALFNTKAKLWVEGRRGLLQKIQLDFQSSVAPKVWFHAASLGEFEQGRPVIEAFKAIYPEYEIILTFFSPSGYEVRKNYTGADYIYYLPADTERNAKRFLEIVNPRAVFFIKYEFWRNYFEAIRNKSIPLISFSTIFRADQIYFKRKGFNRDTLYLIDYFFVQNKLSGELLEGIGLSNWKKVGDTRFDRVLALRNNLQQFEIIERFKGTSKVMVVGSAWKEDIATLLPLINDSDLKFIIAPHEINTDEITSYRNSIVEKSAVFSEPETICKETKVVFVDSIGLLTSLYQYADYAFVGGAFRTGLHNTLEPATFGVPIFFGPIYDKFQEAVDLIERLGAFSVNSSEDLQSLMERFSNDSSFYKKTCEITANYVSENVGATTQIIDYCKQLNL